MTLTGGEIAGIVIASLVGFVILVALCLYLLSLWMKGPTKGTDNPKSMDGKVVVITGANTGIGKVTATDMAKRGARVIILCRDMTRAGEAVTDIKQESGSDKVGMEKLDLASLQSVRECAQKLLETEEKIDILVNNAGIMLCPGDWKTEDGFDMQLGTNHLGHFLLTELLMPLLTKSAASGVHPRIVIVSSMGHKFVNGMNWDDLNWEKSFNSSQAYAQSKLANILHAKELAKRLANTGISVYVLHPGVIATELGRHVQGKYKRITAILYKPIVEKIVKSPFHGAQTTIYCCLDDSIECESGNYYSDCAVKQPSAAATRVEDQKKLWEISEKMVGIAQ